MSRFNTVLRVGRSFPAIVSMANTFVYQHKNPATLSLALSHVVREALAKESDADLFAAGAVMFPDLLVPSGKTLRDAIVDALTAITVKDATTFAGQPIETPEPIQGVSEYRTEVVVTDDDKQDKPVVQGKTFEEMQAMLAEQGEDGCAGGACKI